MLSVLLSLLLAASSISVTSAITHSDGSSQFALPSFSQMVQQMRDNLHDALKQLQALVSKKGMAQQESDMVQAEIQMLSEHLKSLDQIEKNGPEVILKNNKAIAIAVVMMVMAISTSMTTNEELRTRIIETLQPMIERIAGENKTVLLEASLVPMLNQSLIKSSAFLDLMKKVRALFVEFKENTKDLDAAIAELQQ